MAGLYYNDMTAEIPSGYAHEHGENGIRERLGLFAKQLEKELNPHDPMRYINALHFSFRQSISMRTALNLLPQFGDAELVQYKRGKCSPGTVGALLGLEIARQAIGDDWDRELAETFHYLSDEIKGDIPHPTLHERCAQRTYFLDLCSRGWTYGQTYGPVINSLSISDNTPPELHNRIQETRESFGFVLYAAAMTLQCHDGRISLGAHLDPDFAEEADQLKKDPSLWEGVIARLLENP